MDQTNQDKTEKSRLFPTWTSVIVFWSYICLFVSQGLLVTAVQEQKIAGFNSVIVVLLVELTKLLICLIVYLLRSPQAGGLGGAVSDLFRDIKAYRKLLLLYLVPASLYCLYNNLTFVNLSLFDVSTYYCLMQFRIVLTALIYQILFQRRLNTIQWTSLIILTIGCIIKQYGMYDTFKPSHSPMSPGGNGTQTTVASRAIEVVAQQDGESKRARIFTLLWSTSLLLIQMFCSCFAGVYNEYLLKDKSSTKQASFILQNIFMYLDSILCNLLALPLSTAFFGQSSPLFSDMKLSSTLYNLLTSPLVITLILNNALSGLVASFFLKSLNSIVKTFAASLELFAVTFLAWLLFDNKAQMDTIVALTLVSLATVVYSYHPVSVDSPTKLARVDNQNGFTLLPTHGENSPR